MPQCWNRTRGGDGTLFPKKIEFDHSSDSNVLNREEEVVIDEIDICKKIDPDVFAIAGCNLGESEREAQVPARPLSRWECRRYPSAARLACAARSRFPLRLTNCDDSGH